MPTTPPGDVAPLAAPGTAPGGRIEIRDLRAVGVHGVLPEERVRAQPFSLDLDVWLDLRQAAASDELAHTVDYGALVAQVAEVVATSSFQLLEALADYVARQVLAADERVTLVAVTVRKLRPPIPVDVASVGVRVVRARASGADGHPTGE
jgi:7,8-dihydroneopterin aldolase/epimerase/oxygenase